MAVTGRWLGAIGLVLAVLSTGALASRFQAPLDESSWMVESSIFVCRLSHSIPFYGDAVFQRDAGEPGRFQLQSDVARMETGKAALVASAPMWKPGEAPKDMGYVAVSRGTKPVVLDHKYSERLLAVLYAGREVEFTRAPWYGAEHSDKVVLSTVNFQPAYRQYLDCLARLLPVNFEQIRRTAIYFPSGSDRLPREQLQKLDNIALYVSADTSVESFFIDGHSDSNGERAKNLDLSKRRAEAVVELLVKRGISAERITTRWHGERYPVASNRTSKGRAENRRVTIRLEKAGARELPSLARAE